MHTMQGLLWEQWRQNRLWIVASGAFLLMMTFGVWLNQAWILRHFRNDPFELNMLAWIIGITAIGLLFVDQRLREVTLQFPRRQFALPCGTLALVASHLLFKSLIAVALAVLIAFYHSVLFAQPQSFFMTIMILLALVAVTQALLLAAIFGVVTLLVGAARLPRCVFLVPGLRYTMEEAATDTSQVLVLVGWIVAGLRPGGAAWVRAVTGRCGDGGWAADGSCRG